MAAKIALGEICQWSMIIPALGKIIDYNNWREFDVRIKPAEESCLRKPHNGPKVFANAETYVKSHYSEVK